MITADTRSGNARSPLLPFVWRPGLAGARRSPRFHCGAKCLVGCGYVGSTPRYTYPCRRNISQLTSPAALFLARCSRQCIGTGDLETYLRTLSCGGSLHGCDNDLRQQPNDSRPRNPSHSPYTYGLLLSSVHGR